VYGQEAEIRKADCDRLWFNVFSPGKTLAEFESRVVMSIVRNPGLTIEELDRLSCGLDSSAMIRAALERIRRKGFTLIDNFLAGP
jgi:hypothetical protein